MNGNAIVSGLPAAAVCSGEQICSVKDASFLHYRSNRVAQQQFASRICRWARSNTPQASLEDLSLPAHEPTCTRRLGALTSVSYAQGTLRSDLIDPTDLSLSCSRGS